MIREKRKYVRIPIIILVDLFTTDSSVPKGRACIVDLSLGGLAVETEVELKKDTELFLRINLPGRPTPLEVFAEVVRQQEMGNVFRYGLRYTQLNIFEKFKLKYYIRKWIKDHQEKTGSKEKK